jgi:hypothetical protein
MRRLFSFWPQQICQHGGEIREVLYAVGHPDTLPAWCICYWRYGCSPYAWYWQPRELISVFGLVCDKNVRPYHSSGWQGAGSLLRSLRFSLGITSLKIHSGWRGAPTRFSVNFLGFLCYSWAFDCCFSLICHCPLRYAIAQTRQHIR